MTTTTTPAIGHHVTNGTAAVHRINWDNRRGTLYTACTKAVRTTAVVTDAAVTCKTCARRA